MQPPTILVVDDEEDTRLSMGEMLAKEFPGCRVVIVDDGKAAIAALDRTRFDLAIIDYRLPYLNGMEVARHAATTGRVPCVLITGYADPAIAARGKAEGILFGGLHKTATSSEIIAFLKEALAHSRRQT